MRLHVGHPSGERGAPVDFNYGDGRHQIRWRGIGGGPRKGGLSVVPGWRRDPESGDPGREEPG